MYPSLRLVLLASLAAAGHSDPLVELDLKKRATTLIPDSCFNSTGTLETYFNYYYPWGKTHNGAAVMRKDHVSIVDNAYLQLKSTPGPPRKGHHKKQTYLSGTVWAKQRFTVEAGGGLDMQASFVAPVRRGCWPAWWLTGVYTWPPEIDLAEWKGAGTIWLNTFNSSAEVDALEIAYPKPATAWHTVRAELRAEPDNITVRADFFLNRRHIITQYGKDMVANPFYMIIDYQMLGSSNGPGPNYTTYFDVQHLSVTSYNP